MTGYGESITIERAQNGFIVKGHGFGGQTNVYGSLPELLLAVCKEYMWPRDWPERVELINKPQT